MSRPLLIGQAPGPRTDPDLPLFPFPSTSTGGQLQRLMGLRRGEYLLMFERVNLLPVFPGKHKRDDKFPVADARLAAAVLRPMLAGRTVILVGRNVANAFGLGDEFHTWIDLPVRRRCPIARDEYCCRIAIIPHPSGRSRWYNNSEHKEASHEFWESFLRADRKVLSFDTRRSI